MDQNIRRSKEKDEKETGFHKLEPHKQQLILNASSPHPFDDQATSPTEFYFDFLAKKSQFKAKEMLQHRFYIDKVSFNPNASFISCLWHCEFFWILAVTPTEISIFYCPETRSINSFELEKERTLAASDKIKQTDIDKLAKQKLTIPSSLMDMVWMTQNLQAVISLCFGPTSHSSILLKNWANHMYQHRITYNSLQSTNPSFFAKVLFSIDTALQIHWRSCCESTDRTSVNDKVLIMDDYQDQILRHSYFQQIPKSIQDKIVDHSDRKN